MTRSLTGTVTTAIGQPVTQPGLLVQIGFSPVLRLSSRGDVSWGGNTWLSWDIQLSGVSFDVTTPAQSGLLTLGNTDNTIGALLLIQGVAERSIQVWALYGDTPGASDPVMMFSGVGDGFKILPDSGRVTIALEQQSAQTLYTPRRYITRATGFSALPPAGSVVNWNGERFRLGTRKG